MTRPDPTQPHPRVHPTRGQLWLGFKILLSLLRTVQVFVIRITENKEFRIVVLYYPEVNRLELAIYISYYILWFHILYNLYAIYYGSILNRDFSFVVSWLLKRLLIFCYCNFYTRVDVKNIWKCYIMNLNSILFHVMLFINFVSRIRGVVANYLASQARDPGIDSHQHLKDSWHIWHHLRRDNVFSCNLRCRLIFLHGWSRTYRVASLRAGPVGRISYNLYFDCKHVTCDLINVHFLSCLYSTLFS